jgi:hypothetical protein
LYPSLPPVLGLRAHSRQSSRPPLHGDYRHVGNETLVLRRGK